MHPPTSPIQYCMTGRHQGGQTLLPGGFEGKEERLGGRHPSEQMLVCKQQLTCDMQVQNKRMQDMRQPSSVS